ncbi:MAG TPA: Flp family type IVb pilin [Planctomycetota bacterium]|nr:Flp family type IVb pilin [Planctomycetota bacterium]
MEITSRFARDESGLETVEYAIMAGLVVGACVAMIIALGGWVKDTYTTLQTEIE